MSARELSRDYYGNPPDEPEFRCECGAVEDFDREFCRHDACPQCRDAAECCVECGVCHRLTDEFEVDEGVDPICVDCAIAAMDAEDDRRERDGYLLEAKGDEMREAMR